MRAPSLSTARTQRLYEVINADGVADELVWYDQRASGGLKEDGTRVVSRSKVLGGLNGLFFTLMVLRTALPLIVLSTLFGVHESTGGRAFTTWLNFLYRSFKPLVRLPSLEEVSRFTPSNFLRHGYESMIMLLDATEMAINRSWQTEMNWATYSSYKGKQTAKVLIGTTPGGAICFVSDAYPGGMTDVDVVKASGLVGKLVEGGLARKGCTLMADRGFNPMSPLLVKEGILYVAPPYKRRNEAQFTDADMDATYDVANLRIHVERAIGSMKNWDILVTPFNHKQLDHAGMCVQVVAALVNMIDQPHASDA